MSVRCPAAHSMDTTWFAVDADGAVAEFQTGEAGAVPLRATTSPEAGDFDDWPLVALAAARAMAAGRVPESAGFSERDQRAIVVFRPVPATETRGYRESAARALAVERELGDVLVLYEGAHRIVGSRSPLTVAELRKLAEEPCVERVVLDDDLGDWDGIALYRYGNDDYDDPGAYGRERAPEAALHVSDVPASMRERLATLTLPIRFAEAATLHLADYLRDEECGTWDNTTLRGAPREEGAGPRDGTRRRTGGANVVLLVGLVVVIFVALALVFRR